MKRPLILGAALSLLAGCSATPDNHYYLLSAAPPDAHRPAVQAGAGATLASVRLPGVLDRPQLVVRTGAETVEIREFDRWAEPLADMTPRILAQDLALRGSSNSPRRVTIVIDDFMVETTGTAHLNGRWWDTQSPARPFTLTQSGAGNDGAQIAAAMSALLSQLASEIVESP